MNKHIWALAGILTFLIIWHIASLFVASSLILPGPISVLQTFLSMLPTAAFQKALWASFLRVLLGLIVSVPTGIALGLLCGLFPPLDYFLRPFLAFIAATPVMAIILIIFLWAGSEGTPVVTAFLIVFPVMVQNTKAGVLALDTNLKEMCRVFQFSRLSTLQNLYIPSIVPYLLSALKTALSLCWKVVVAAEVLVQPIRALGTGMQNAKAQLETPSLFAWTCATVIAAALCQGLLKLAIIKGRIKR
ncbi:MAG: ABC transporter permease subunit [Spirochaetaceae bacterium]|jgi:NitT/TauT family transport system permease protein|nr:ABC transporter permease subunit [Spirochaetaceae bacterium]